MEADDFASRDALYRDIDAVVFGELPDEGVIYDGFVGHVLTEQRCPTCGIPTRITYLLMPDYAIASHGETPIVCYPSRLVFSIRRMIVPHID